MRKDLDRDFWVRRKKCWRSINCLPRSNGKRLYWVRHVMMGEVCRRGSRGRGRGHGIQKEMSGKRKWRSDHEKFRTPCSEWSTSSRHTKAVDDDGQVKADILS